MNYLLLAVMAVTLLIKIGISKDWLRPSVLFTLGFTYAALILAINTNKWGYTISLKTALIIIIAQFSIWMGEAFGIRTGVRDYRVGIKFKPVGESGRSRQIIYGLSILCTLVLIYIRMRNIRSSNALYGVGQYYLSSYRRYGIEDTSGDFIMKLFEIISGMFCYYYFCDICINGKSDKKRVIRDIIPIVLYVVSCVLSSARSSILHFIFACTLIWILSSRYRDYRIKLSMKAKRRIIIILIAGLVSFAMLGYLTGKTQTGGFFDSIEVYSAGAVPALDGFIERFDGNPQFGYYTLQGLRRLLELMGVNVTYNVSYYSHGDYVSFGNGYVTNIYTCFRNYIFDYGYVGSQLVICLIGFVFGKLFMRLTSSERISPYRLTLYSIIVFYVFFSFITERVFSQILTATMIIGVIVLSCIFQAAPLEKGINHD